MCAYDYILKPACFIIYKYLFLRSSGRDPEKPMSSAALCRIRTNSGATYVNIVCFSSHRISAIYTQHTCIYVDWGPVWMSLNESTLAKFPNANHTILPHAYVFGVFVLLHIRNLGFKMAADFFYVNTICIL